MCLQLMRYMYFLLYFGNMCNALHPLSEPILLLILISSGTTNGLRYILYNPLLYICIFDWCLSVYPCLISAVYTSLFKGVWYWLKLKIYDTYEPGNMLVNKIQAAKLKMIKVLLCCEYEAHATYNSYDGEFIPTDSLLTRWRHQMETFSYWPFVRGIHRSSGTSPHKGQWRGASMFSFIGVWINNWVNNREAGDLICYRAHYGVAL